MEYRNAQYIEGGRINCEICHPRFGWIEFTADPNDPEQSGRDLHAEIVAAGNAAPYQEPSELETLQAWRATATCTPLQGQFALGESRWLAVEAFLDDPLTPWAMRQTVRAASIWRRNSQDIDALAYAIGLTDLEVDDLFRLAVTLNV